MSTDEHMVSCERHPRNKGFIAESDDGPMIDGKPMRELQLLDAFHIFTKSGGATTDGKKSGVQQHFLVVAKDEAAALTLAMACIEEGYPRPQVTIERVIRTRYPDTNEEIYCL